MIEAALVMSERLIAVAVILQTIELFQIRKTYSDEGVWRWAELKDEMTVFPVWVRICFEALLPYPRFLGVLVLRLAAAAALLFGTGALALLILFLTTVLIALRWRGAFNGGSDSMTAIVLLSLFIARSIPLAAAGCLLYIALQASLSYFIAGWVKLRNPEWRSGGALLRYLRTPAYGAPPALGRMLALPGASAAAAWGIMLFECAFPLGLVAPALAPVFIGAAFAFHLANVFIFGLNRFLFAWAASYPAYYFAAEFLNRGKAW